MAHDPRWPVGSERLEQSLAHLRGEDQQMDYQVNPGLSAAPDRRGQFSQQDGGAGPNSHYHGQATSGQFSPGTAQHYDQRTISMEGAGGGTGTYTQYRYSQQGQILF